MTEPLTKEEIEKWRANLAGPAAYASYGHRAIATIDALQAEVARLKAMPDLYKELAKKAKASAKRWRELYRQENEIRMKLMDDFKAFSDASQEADAVADAIIRRHESATRHALDIGSQGCAYPRPG